MKEYYFEMDNAAVGTTFHCWKDGGIVNFAKIEQHQWFIRTHYLLEGMKDTILTFCTLCTTIEASEFRKLCTED